MSFLQRLKGRGVRTDEKLLSAEEESAIDKVAQLSLDVYQTNDQVVVYAQAPGADIDDVQVSIEGDADIILLEGKTHRPEFMVFPKKRPEGSFFAQECTWGEFYRRIILPESVDIDSSDAKIKNGVLILVLPFLKPSQKEKVTLKVKNETRTAKKK